MKNNKFHQKKKLLTMLEALIPTAMKKCVFRTKTTYLKILKG